MHDLKDYVAFFIINDTEFRSSNLVSKELQVDLEGIGLKDIVVTRSNITSLIYEGYLLGVRMNNKNPFFQGDYGVLIDVDKDIYLLIKKADNEA